MSVRSGDQLFGSMGELHWFWRHCRAMTLPQSRFLEGWECLK
jgi:hypothetical protein